ncbi:MAG TPA: RHS repeat-associated core domain-containing protein [Chthoniobacterales bacterium]|nr:RHS repeat-associated core domain-containing protein [Chthoniobacterales bacterium]
MAGFNALNQPVQMTSFFYEGTGNWMWFGYDPLGRCVKRWVGPGDGSAPNGAIYFYYDGWNLVQEGLSANSVSRTYVHGARVDEIVASAAGGGSWLYHQYDARGHCIMLTNGSGGIVEQYEYDAFGQPYIYDANSNLVARNLGSPEGNRFLFTGREWLKELRVYDYRNRLYQPELGRFVQPDPKEFEAGDYNLYRYCHNDPVNRGDPFGLLDMDTAIQRALFETGTTLLGAGIGALIGGGGGGALGLAGGPAAPATVPAGAAVGGLGGVVVGGAAGLGIGKVLSPIIFKEDTEGTYEFPDQQGGEKPYVGQSGNVEGRLGQHQAAGRLKPGTEKVTKVEGGKTAREIAEHKRIQELTGGKPARESDKVTNKKDPIGPARIRLLEDK